jgi:protein phosphatase 1 regulatory subunit 7
MSGNGEEQQTESEGKKTQFTFVTDPSNSQTQGKEASGLEQGISKLGHDPEEQDSASPTAASASASAPAPEAQHDITITADTEHHEHTEKKDRRPRDSKGWDGKLRLPKKTDGAAEGSPEAESGDEDGESDKEDDDVGGPITRGVVRLEREDGPPPEELEADEDLLEGMDSDEEDIDLVHCKITSLPALKLGAFRKLKGC